MPRDANGNYTLPSGNPVVSGTTITTNWANPTMSDIANEITDSLSRSGEGGMLVPFQNIDGALGTPGITWVNETKTGFYRADTNDQRATVNGIARQRWTATTVQIWDDVAKVWNDIATTNALGDYLPLTGGTLSGALTVDEDNSAITIQASTETGALSQTWIQFLDSLGSDIGYFGHGSNSTDLFGIGYGASNIFINGNAGNVEITAPTTNINGKAVVIADANTLTLRALSSDQPVRLDFLRQDGDSYGYVGKGDTTDFEADLLLACNTGNVTLVGQAAINLNAPTVAASGQVTAAAAAPVAAADLTRKDYVDAQIAGISFPQVFAGRIASDGTAINLPAGWTCSELGTAGNYQINHNLGIDSNGLSVTATMKRTSAGYIVQTGVSNTNMVQVQCYDTTPFVESNEVSFVIVVL